MAGTRGLNFSERPGFPSGVPVVDERYLRKMYNDDVTSAEDGAVGWVAKTLAGLVGSLEHVAVGPAHHEISIYNESKKFGGKVLRKF